MPNDTTTVPIGADALSVVAAFLLGEGPLQGVWYGELPEGERGKYWWRKHLRAAIASAAQPAAVLPGYVLVPVEPTDEMLKSGDEKTWVLPARDCWRAMLAAAPKAVQQFGAGDAVFAFASMLTTLPRVVPFGSAAWATPGVELATAFNAANGLSVSLDFPSGIVFPKVDGDLLAVIEKAAAPQPASPSYTHADVLEAHTNGYELGMRQEDRATKPAPAAQEDAEDAARYRCIRRGQHWSVIDGIGNELRAEALDTAIDAARSQSKEGGEA